MKTNTLLLMIFLPLACLAQVKYESGYFIKNSGERVDGLIRNAESINTPTSFKYRKAKDQPTQTISISDVKMVEISNQVTFIRSRVKIDQSSDDLALMSTSEKPDFLEQDVFLKELAAGDVKLYSYTTNDMRRFFYQVGNGLIEPLIYKPYKINEQQVAHNEDYKMQLANILVCSLLTPENMQQLEYSERSLVAIFKKYYRCSNQSYSEKQVPNKNIKINVHLRPRVNQASLALTHMLFNSSYEMGTKIGLGLGAEAELVLPFNKNKWALIVEPQYQAYNTEGPTTIDYLTGVALATTVKYQSIGFPIGVRYYMFTGDNSALFLNAWYAINVPLQSSIVFRRADGSIEDSFGIKSQPNLGIGLGYRYKRFSVEARYFSEQNLTKASAIWTSTFRQSSIILGIQLF